MREVYLPSGRFGGAHALTSCTLKLSRVHKEPGSGTRSLWLLSQIGMGREPLPLEGVETSYHQTGRDAQANTVLATVVAL